MEDDVATSDSAKNRPKAKPKSRKDAMLVAIVPRRLGVPTQEERLPESVLDDDHKHAVQQACAWQELASNATFWEIGATHHGTEMNRSYELAGLMASTGEQLALAIAAEGEVALWRDIRDSDKPDAAHEMSMRAMAEAQCHFVIGAGHELANVAVRALCLNQALREGLIKKIRGPGTPPSFAPLSSNKADWIPMNRVTCKALRTVATSNAASEVANLVEPVVELGTGDAWRDLLEQRGRDFHRWRPQTHGVEGVPQSSPWKCEGDRRSLGLGNPTYEEAAGRAEETARIATNAMLEMARSMEAFMDRWPLASGPLGGPEFELGSMIL